MDDKIIQRAAENNEDSLVVTPGGDMLHKGNSWLYDSWDGDELQGAKHVLQDAYYRAGYKIDLNVILSEYDSKWDVLLIKRYDY